MNGGTGRDGAVPGAAPAGTELPVVAAGAVGAGMAPEGRENGPASRVTAGDDPEANAGRAGNDGRGAGVTCGTLGGVAAGIGATAGATIGLAGRGAAAGGGELTGA